MHWLYNLLICLIIFLVILHIFFFPFFFLISYILPDQGVAIVLSTVLTSNF